ncbi:MAG: PTS transporter subunit EIIC, partial [Galactobacillus timonensis]
MFDSVVNCTFGILGLLAAFGIGYHMALQYKIDPFSNACMTSVAFILATLDNNFTINTEFLSSEGMFTAILVALLTTFIYKYFIDHKIY